MAHRESQRTRSRQLFSFGLVSLRRVGAGLTSALLLAGGLLWATSQESIVPGGEVDGPHLEWRSLSGAVTRMELSQAGVDWADWGVWMRPVGMSPAPALEGEDVARIQLSNGDHVRARCVGGDDSRLALEGPEGVALPVSIDQLSSLRFSERHAGLTVLEPAAQGDRLYRLSGEAVDRVDGVLLGFSEQGIRLETSLGERVFPWGEVVALFLEPLSFGLEDDALEEETAVVHLTCGSRLRGSLRALHTTGLVLDSGFGEWRIPYAWLHELMRLDGSFRVLSWMPREAGEVVRSPFDPPGAPPLGMVWETQVDRSVQGQVLRAGGRHWSLGLGVHAPSRLRWKLSKNDCALRISAALDASARRGDVLGSVEFQVWLDGEPVWSSGVRQGDQAPITPDPIPLQGAQVLELVVTDGGDGPVLDRAAWLEPLLIQCPQ